MSTKHEHQGIIAATLAYSAEVHAGSGVSTAVQADHRAASIDRPAVETALPGRMPHLLAAHLVVGGVPMRRLLLFLALLLIGFPSRSATAQTGPLCFPTVPGIGNCIEGRFRQYWEQNGGLAVFGYPITAAQNEVNRDTSQTYLTQWFERTRFELHTENQAPYDVLLGRLGDDRLRQLGRDWWTFPKASPAAGALRLASLRASNGNERERGHRADPMVRAGTL
jgi:hypothetical protein